jgi:hypothetical protein
MKWTNRKKKRGYREKRPVGEKCGDNNILEAEDIALDR